MKGLSPHRYDNGANENGESLQANRAAHLSQPCRRQARTAWWKKDRCSGLGLFALSLAALSSSGQWLSSSYIFR